MVAEGTGVSVAEVDSVGVGGQSKVMSTAQSGHVDSVLPRERLLLPTDGWGVPTQSGVWVLTKHAGSREVGVDVVSEGGVLWGWWKRVV